MKTKLLITCLVFGTTMFILSACTKDEETNPAMMTSINHDLPYNNAEVVEYIDWIENFNSASTLTANWNFFGSQQPKWYNEAFGRYGLFDNNGSPPYGNTAVSLCPIGDGRGFIIESDIYINLTNPSGTCICPSIGVSRNYNPWPIGTNGTVDFGLMMRLQYIGSEVGNVPPYARHHAWLQLFALLDDGTMASPGNYALNADNMLNGWHNMKIVVLRGGMTRFYLDNNLMWITPKSIHKSLMAKKNLLLGSTSPGIAGKAYHDFIKISYITPD